jgi:hypothetical protein
MKKIYLSLFLTGFAMSGAFAQNLAHPAYKLGEATPKMTSGKPVTNGVTQKAAVWTETFDIGSTPGGASTPGPTFTTSNGVWSTGGVDGGVWKHSYYTTSGEWSTGTAAFAPTSAADGFMLFDADSVNFPISPNYTPLTGELISPAIDLTGEASALLSIEQDFRFCCTGTHDINVQVSTDGGSTWSAPYDLLNATAANDDFFTTNGSSYVQFANISGVAAGNIINLKFTWDGVLSGSSHYYWNFDDVCISSLPTDDIQVTASWISGVNNGGIEYGRNPSDQVDSDWFVGTQVYNFGATNATNVTTVDDYTGASTFSSTGTDALLEPDSTVNIEQTETLSLSVGTYTGTHTATMDATDTNPVDNVGTREFEVTESSTSGLVSEYSMDGIDVYTQNVIIGSIGTNSFTGGEDGLVLAGMYSIKAACQPIGIRVILGTGTVAGGEIYGSIKDTSTVLADDMTSLFQTDGSAGAVTVTAADVTAGYKDLYFTTPPTLNPGTVYAAVELYSNGNSADIVVRDDETVAQPSLASVIYIPGDQTYTNGTAIGVRLLFGPTGGGDTDGDGVLDATEVSDGTDPSDMCSFVLASATEPPSAAWNAADCDNDGVTNGDEVAAGSDPLVSLGENSLEGVSVYPNPSEGLVTITNDNNIVNTIVVYDMLGQVILTKEASSNTTIDLSIVGTGIYMVKVANKYGSMVENVVIK